MDGLTTKPGAHRRALVLGYPAVAGLGAAAAGMAWLLGTSAGLPRPALERDPAGTRSIAAPPDAPSSAALAGLARASAAVGTSVVLQRIETDASGQVVAMLQINGGMPASHGLGDALGPGVRLARIEVDSVWIETRGRLVRLAPPANAALSRRPRLTAAPSPRLSATLPRPPTREVAQLLDSPPTGGVVTASPQRANPARSGIDRMVAAEAWRLSSP